MLHIWGSQWSFIVLIFWKNRKLRVLFSLQLRRYFPFVDNADLQGISVVLNRGIYSISFVMIISNLRFTVHFVNNDISISLIYQFRSKTIDVFGLLSFALPAAALGWLTWRYGSWPMRLGGLSVFDKFKYRKNDAKIIFLLLRFCPQRITFFCYYDRLKWIKDQKWTSLMLLTSKQKVRPFFNTANIECKWTKPTEWPTRLVKKK
jgi:hypothetical protein